MVSRVDTSESRQLSFYEITLEEFPEGVLFDFREREWYIVGGEDRTVYDGPFIEFRQTDNFIEYVSRPDNLKLFPSRRYALKREVTKIKGNDRHIELPWVRLDGMPLATSTSNHLTFFLNERLTDFYKSLGDSSKNEFKDPAIILGEMLPKIVERDPKSFTND